MFFIGRLVSAAERAVSEARNPAAHASRALAEVPKHPRRAASGHGCRHSARPAEHIGVRSSYKFGGLLLVPLAQWRRCAIQLTPRMVTDLFLLEELTVIHFVFANEFINTFEIRPRRQNASWERPWAGEDVRVIHRYIVFEAGIHTLVPFHDVERFGVHVSAHLRLFVKSHGIDDQSVSIPQ